MTQIHPKQLASGGASNGQALVYNSTSGLFEPGSVSTSWTTAYEVDFTSLATNTLTNGTEVIDGKNWTVANQAGYSSFMEVTNGTGVQITPLGNSNRFDTNDRTGPLCTIPILSLFPTFDPGKHILRLWFKTNTTNQFVNGGYQGWLAGLEPPSAVGTRHYMAVGARRDFDKNILSHMRQNVWYHIARSNSEMHISDGVFVLEVKPYSHIAGYAISQSGLTWPAFSTLTGMGNIACLQYQTTDTSPMMYGTDANVWFGAYGWTYASFTLIMQKMKIEYAVMT